MFTDHFSCKKNQLFFVTKKIYSIYFPKRKVTLDFFLQNGKLVVFYFCFFWSIECSFLFHFLFQHLSSV